MLNLPCSDNGHVGWVSPPQDPESPSEELIAHMEIKVCVCVGGGGECVFVWGMCSCVGVYVCLRLYLWGPNMGS